MGVSKAGMEEKAGRRVGGREEGRKGGREAGPLGRQWRGKGT
jgi:hypothetical protein